MTFPQPYKKLETKYHLVQFEAEGVLRISFNRPPVNAWSDADDSDVAAVVLSGEGRCFTAGLDLKSNELFEVLANIEDTGRRAFAVHSHIKHFQAAISSIEKCAKPVIAAAHGIAYGLGIDLLSACDIRYVASCAKLSIRATCYLPTSICHPQEVDIGLAADIGTLQRFPKVIGNDSVARELAYTARIFDAQYAQSIGFVSKVTEAGQAAVVAAALATAKEIASKSPVAVQSSKAILIHARDHPVDDGLAFTAAWNAAMLQTEDIPIATQAVMAKQTPKFSKL
ncbi:hypothetical protein OC834_006683 [Tilletia horrida]|nr:hypothetical protein OC834_006683 [Tilletia horrida]